MPTETKPDRCIPKSKILRYVKNAPRILRRTSSPVTDFFDLSRLSFRSITEGAGTADGVLPNEEDVESMAEGAVEKGETVTDGFERVFVDDMQEEEEFDGDVEEEEEEEEEEEDEDEDEDEDEEEEEEEDEVNNVEDDEQGDMEEEEAKEEVRVDAKRWEDEEDDGRERERLDSPER